MRLGNTQKGSGFNGRTEVPAAAGGGPHGPRARHEGRTRMAWGTYISTMLACAPRSYVACDGTATCALGAAILQCRADACSNRFLTNPEMSWRPHFLLSIGIRKAFLTTPYPQRSEIKVPFSGSIICPFSLIAHDKHACDRGFMFLGPKKTTPSLPNRWNTPMTPPYRNAPILAA